jgi:protein-S-isoprenylcysteine O-methyltransferase Ste14
MPYAGAAPEDAPGSPARRVAVFLYGTTVYVLFLATFLYMIGFVGGGVVPKHVDTGAPGALIPSLLVNAGLLGCFALQHALMARRWFKRWITRSIPRAMERSTFVLSTCLVLALLVWQWRPLPQVVWNVQGFGADALLGLSALGWGVVLFTTWLIDHFELFGVRQVWNYLRGRPHAPPTFRERLLYRVVRHPLMVGFLVAFWATPVMSAGHLLFAILTTGYIFVGVAIEERDLVKEHGERYLDYRRRVRAFLPLPRVAP